MDLTTQQVQKLEDQDLDSDAISDVVSHRQVCGPLSPEEILQIAKRKAKALFWQNFRSLDYEDVEEVANDAALAIITVQGRQEIRDYDALAYSCVIRRLNGRTRSKKQRSSQLFHSDLGRFDDPRMEDPHLSSMVQRLIECLDQLNEIDKEVIHLFYWENWTGAEISAELGISSDAVYKKLSRSKEKLRSGLGCRGE